MTHLRPQNKQEQDKRILEGHTQEERCKCGSKPPQQDASPVVDHRCSGHGLRDLEPAFIST